MKNVVSDTNGDLVTSPCGSTAASNTVDASVFFLVLAGRQWPSWQPVCQKGTISINNGSSFGRISLRVVPSLGL